MNQQPLFTVQISYPGTFINLIRPRDVAEHILKIFVEMKTVLGKENVSFFFDETHAVDLRQAYAVTFQPYKLRPEERIASAMERQVKEQDRGDEWKEGEDES